MEPELQATEPKTDERKILESERVELQRNELKAEHYSVKPQLSDPRIVEPQTIEPQIFETQIIDPITVEPLLSDPQIVEPQTVEPQILETQILDPITVEPQLSDRPNQNIEPQNLLYQGRKTRPLVDLSSDYQSLALWRQPILTLYYFLKESFIHMKYVFWKIIHYRRILNIVISFLIIVLYLNSTHYSNCPTLFWLQKKFLWCFYWFCLGMLSSVGLGTGIHTFALYLGPYIASVTVAANECGYLNFGENSYTGVIECPQEPDPRWVATFWNIMCKVRLESYMWGLGTAIGELPPYFMGRAARISGQDEERDVLREFEELQRKKIECPESLTPMDRIKLTVRDLVVNAGFWGILVCASIPNPFFDLAGITCGNFFVPFWTFFGATLIGKAVIKTTVQQVFIILSFNKDFLTGVVEILSTMPVVGQRLERYFSEYIARQKEKFYKDRMDDNPNNSWIFKAYHVFVICTFLYFFISIINSLAQNHYKRLRREKLRRNE